jgi:hypothetical protein
MMLQKLQVRELPKLRKSAANAPHCFSCGVTNRGGLLVLAHSNELAHGRGSHFKTPDYFGAILCQECHDQVDGRTGNLTKDGKHEMHKRAHEKTLQYWFESGLIKCV